MKSLGRQVKKALMLTLGWICIVAGIAGIFLPFLQGFLLLAVGAVILSKNSEWFNAKIQKLKAKYPRFKKAMDRFDSWFS